VLLENLADLFNLSGRHAIDLAIASNNIAIVRDAALHSNLILLSIRLCVQNELAAKLMVELPVDLKTVSKWHSVTLKNTVPHPAVTSLKQAIAKVAGAT